MSTLTAPNFGANGYLHDDDDDDMVDQKHEHETTSSDLRTTMRRGDSAAVAYRCTFETAQRRLTSNKSRQRDAITNLTPPNAVALHILSDVVLTNTNK